MILWRLRGYADPEGERAASHVECVVERCEQGCYQLGVIHNGETQIQESHESIRTAQDRADAVRTKLLLVGWLEVPDSATE